MGESQNVQVVKQCYDAFLSGDIDKLLTLMAKDIEWVLPDVEGIPFSGRRHGRDAVAEFFQIETSLQQGREFTPQEFTAQDDRVVVTGHYEWTVKASGAQFGCDWCHIFHIANGEISKFTEFTDTYQAALAYEVPAVALAGAARPNAGRPEAH
jgi:ketosteroid isomerase-like protein